MNRGQKIRFTNAYARAWKILIDNKYAYSLAHLGSQLYAHGFLHGLEIRESRTPAPEARLAVDVGVSIVVVKALKMMGFYVLQAEPSEKDLHFFRRAKSHNITHFVSADYDWELHALDNGHKSIHIENNACGLSQPEVLAIILMGVLKLKQRDNAQI